MRANYQQISRNSVSSAIQRSPHQLDMGGVQILKMKAFDWMDGDPALQAVLQLLSCNCTRSCKIPDCPFRVNRLKCTDM